MAPEGTPSKINAQAGCLGYRIQPGSVKDFQVSLFSSCGVAIIKEISSLGEEQIRKLRTGIVPFGKLQERVWGIVPFLNRYGPDLLADLIGLVVHYNLQVTIQVLQQLL